MRLKNIIVSKFNVKPDSELVENVPYVLENVETYERQIGTLVLCSEEKLVFNVWDNGLLGSVTLTPSNIESYHIYKASSKDGISIQIEDKDATNNVPQSAINKENYHPTATIVCRRIIDYKNGTTEELTTGIENFYKVDTESGVTVIKQFLYKVTLVKDNDLVQYAIMLPVSESDKREYMDKGWKIHPMFHNKENDCYMNSVVIKEKHVMDFTHREQDSITIQILSGLQMLYLVEFGLNQNPKLGCSMYAGVKYDDGCIVISNAYTDETNHLVIDDEIESILVYRDYGYISRFLYKNENYDWLFLPKETTDKPTLTDSFYAGPSRNRKNIILWGDSDSNAGIFRLWINSTSTTDDDYIVPWEFGE